MAMQSGKEWYFQHPDQMRIEAGLEDANRTPLFCAEDE
jgi:hypothetical protein